VDFPLPGARLPMRSFLSYGTRADLMLYTVGLLGALGCGQVVFPDLCRSRKCSIETEAANHPCDSKLNHTTFVNVVFPLQLSTCYMVISHSSYERVADPLKVDARSDLWLMLSRPLDVWPGSSNLHRHSQ
jgi:hypothetical protein